MDFLFVENLGVGIDLTILRRNTQRHSVLLCQHEGVLHADNTRIGNHNNVNIELSLFFEKSRSTACDIALTPEYSCPLSIIEEIVSQVDNWPAAEKLWTVGCESMTKQQLSAHDNSQRTKLPGGRNIWTRLAHQIKSEFHR